MSVIQPNHAGGVGLIIPPPRVREFLETTASFVGKKPAVEAKILQRHQNDPNFSFLKPDDPYHAYYRKRVAEVREQLSNDVSEPQKKDASTQQPANQAQPLQRREHDEKTTTKKSAIVSILKSARVKNESSRKEPTEPPPDDIFTLPKTAPAPTPLALDVMKLSAEFVALHGEQFLSMLSRKESRNPLFDFLKPLHPHYIIFQRLLEAYTIFIDPDKKADLVKRVEGLTKREVVMDAVWYMHDWECLQAEREHDATLDESERLKAAMIDWHDFVVLETIEFNENDQLPAPIADTQQLPRILAAAQKAEDERIKNASDVDMEIDEPNKDPRMVVDTVADIPSNLIRPAVASRQPQQNQQTETTIVLPSGQKVPLSKVQESVKAELINPAYKDERARAAEKNRLQNLAGGEEMARNLARLDARRKDGVVYNRADLQSAIPQRGNVDEEVEKRLGQAVKSGPELPDDGRVVKKARIEKAVEELSRKKEIEEGIDLEAVADIVDAAGGESASNGLLSEEAWLAKQGNTALVRIRLPNHANTEWLLQGQEVEMKAPLKRSVAKLKGVITKLVKIPVNKQKLWVEGVGFMKDKMSLASYNIGDGCVVKLEVKERGGRKRGGG